MSRPLAPNLPPKSFTASAAEIRRILAMGWIDIPPERTFNGNAAPGDFLEHLLGGGRNNRDSPDLADWEVKFHGGNALLTLFHKEPEPRGVMSQFVHTHGWKDDMQRISFRHTLSGQSDRGFYVVNEDDRIYVRNRLVDSTSVPFWRHNTLLNAAGSKLRRLILVDGEYRAIERKVIYRSATAYWDFDLTGFFRAIEIGTIYIDFDARTKNETSRVLRNHGTKFRIHVRDIPTIYAHSRRIT